ncbi:MAG: pilW2, partial [Gammaproteobacteria bacterium]|nr:pilW2 [Gammaproteobacteria bacterium]
IQTNANIAIGILQQELRMAGFAGCAKIGELTGRLKAVDKFFTAENSVLGSQGVGSNWQPHLPPRLYHVKPETDVISIWFRQARSYPAVQKSDGSLAILTKNIPFEAGDILLLSSCERAELLKVSCKRLDQKNCNKQDLLIPRPRNHYPQAELAPLRYNGYFISQSTHLSQDGKSTYGLFRKSLNSTAHAQELVEGIEAMKISYGIKTSALAPLVFLFASQVQHWQEVHVVRIALLVTSINNVLDKPQSYQFNGKLYQANDRILRREWVTYIGLREK